jgi:hypothetical protein
VTSSPSFIDKIIDACLPICRVMTRSDVVDDSRTSFWIHKWLPGKPLADRFPALFSHSTCPHATLACMVGEGLRLQPCLTSATVAELATIEVLLAAVSLREGTDCRFIDSPSAPPFSSWAAYRMLAEPCA